MIDGLLGTGGRGGLRGARGCRCCAELDGPGAAAALVVACDLPSGVDATTGEVHGPVLRADLTVTFGAYKSGLLSSPAEQFSGELKLVDLGIGDHLGAAGCAPTGAWRLSQHCCPTHWRPTTNTRAVWPESSPDPHSTPVPDCWRWPRPRLAGRAWSGIWGRPQVAAALHVRNPEVVCSEDSPTNVRVQAWLAWPRHRWGSRSAATCP